MNGGGAASVCVCLCVCYKGGCLSECANVRWVSRGKCSAGWAGMSEVYVGVFVQVRTCVCVCVCVLMKGVNLQFTSFFLQATKLP